MGHEDSDASWGGDDDARATWFSKYWRHQAWGRFDTVARVLLVFGLVVSIGVTMWTAVLAVHYSLAVP